MTPKTVVPKLPTIGGVPQTPAMIRELAMRGSIVAGQTGTPKTVWEQYQASGGAPSAPAVPAAPVIPAVPAVPAVPTPALRGLQQAAPNPAAAVPRRQPGIEAPERQMGQLQQRQMAAAPRPSFAGLKRGMY